VTSATQCDHAVTSYEDGLEREVGIDSLLPRIMEACADTYAFKWGFKGEVPTDRPEHHSAQPGTVVPVEGVAFRVDEQFFFRRYPEPDEPAPTAAEVRALFRNRARAPRRRS